MSYITIDTYQTIQIAKVEGGYLITYEIPGGIERSTICETKEDAFKFIDQIME